jgi:hypothetical protein
MALSEGDESPKEPSSTLRQLEDEAVGRSRGTIAIDRDVELAAAGESRSTWTFRETWPPLERKIARLDLAPRTLRLRPHRAARWKTLDLLPPLPVAEDDVD